MIIVKKPNTDNEQKRGCVDMKNINEIVKTIIEEMVDYPELVKISETGGDQITLLEVRVDKCDLGKVIGKQGRNAQALRTIVSAISAKNKQRVRFEITERSY